MTLHQLFDLSTMEHRHLVIVYVLVAVVQGGYLALLLLSGRRLRSSGRD